ncbi:unnamed protein product [Soboliphyme baturini]|uniref:Peptidase_M13 domain-containing protein n=1 Tax=Soboliphyme baturini TaxID=241478 RepID=A0A183I9S1_9BILA|nr:unnamed protein product [Soboliphyme baturini]
MDKETKQNIYKKIDNIVKNVAFPAWMMSDTDLEKYYEALSVKIVQENNFMTNVISLNEFLAKQQIDLFFNRPNRHQFGGSPIAANAWYSSQYNSLTIPMALMNPGLFAINFPMATNYGALGSIIGHELVHAFDGKGIQFYYNGSLHRWMSDYSLRGFNNVRSCLIEQYDEFCYFPSDVCVNGTRTVNENIADIGGLQAAYYAYQHYVKVHGEESRIAGLEQYSMEQIFFLSFAHNWCEYQTKEELRRNLKDVHSPPDARVIIPLRDFEPFGRAFNCRIGDRMRPKVHCNAY